MSTFIRRIALATAGRIAVLVVAFALPVFAGAALAVGEPAAASTGETQIVYSETYLRYIALFPGGAASNGCVLAVALSGERGVCTTEYDPIWFYPDGTTGGSPWVVDPASPTGWSIPVTNRCPDYALVPDYYVWVAYVDGTNYPGSVEVPALTDAEVECGIAAIGWWF